MFLFSGYIYISDASRGFVTLFRGLLVHLAEEKGASDVKVAVSAPSKLEGEPGVRGLASATGNQAASLILDWRSRLSCFGSETRGICEGEFLICGGVLIYARAFALGRGGSEETDLRLAHLSDVHEDNIAVKLE